MLDRLLKLNEGVKFKPYRCTAGKMSIGVGRNLDDVGISAAEAEMLLANDIARASADVRTLAPWSDALDEVRRAALVDLCFNLGAAGLAKFKRFLAAMERGDWPDAATELRNSKWWHQVGDRGPRAERMVLTGRWPKELGP